MAQSFPLLLLGALSLWILGCAREAAAPQSGEIAMPSCKFAV